MTIKIPSSHIFEREYSASKENRINQLDIAYIKANPKTEVGYTISQGTHSGKTVGVGYNFITGGTKSGDYSISVQIDPVYYDNVWMPSKISKLSDFGYVSDLYYGSNNPNVKCTVSFKKITYKYQGGEWIEDKTEIFSQQPQPIELARVNINNSAFSAYFDFSDTVLFYEKTHIDYSPDHLGDKENFTNLYAEEAKLFAGGICTVEVKDKEGNISSTYSSRVSYTPSEIQWELFGDVIVADYENRELTITEEDITPTDDGIYRIEGSEILQNIGRRYDGVIRAYANGKKTATLTVAYGDYYDHSTGDLKISVGNNDLPMGFSIYDRVIPYVFSAKGDKPLSTNKDGTPTEFVVLQVEPFYDGSTLQKIYLQEA